MDKKAFTETAAGKQRTARRQRAERAPRDRRLVRQRMATCVRGLLFAGTGYLFGAAPIAFGACPLGLSLLAASSGTDSVRIDATVILASRCRHRRVCVLCSVAPGSPVLCGSARPAG